MGVILTELVHKKVIGLADMVRTLSSAPRKILGLEEIRIKTGEKANLTIVDPEMTWKVNAAKFYSRSRNTPFQDWTLRGKALGVINKGLYFILS